mmetsp:Transcript_12207/g.18727  ORF Transcript_12207/g.18727 Transcript_12207/m.18727 type:complete len:295 (+) Transcript_12207:135-1019(+)
MGRVARYKKVKSIDPYSKNGSIMSDVWGEGDNGRRKKKRSRTAQKLRARKEKRGKRDVGLDQGYDLPPIDEDDFDMDDLVGSLKKREMVDPLQDDSKPGVAFKRVIADPPTADSNANILAEETKEAKILKFGAEHSIKRKEKSFVQPRMEGESKRAFQKRMITESKQIIGNDKMKAKTNEEKKRKKKDFLNLKKKKKKQNNSQEVLQSVDNGSDEVDFNATDQVLFGEQVERPPTFPQLPRGAKMNKTQLRQSRSGMNSQQREIEKLAMERLRQEVQAKYAQLKEQRRKMATNR